MTSRAEGPSMGQLTSHFLSYSSDRPDFQYTQGYIYTTAKLFIFLGGIVLLLVLADACVYIKFLSSKSGGGFANTTARESKPKKAKTKKRRRSKRKRGVRQSKKKNKGLKPPFQTNQGSIPHPESSDLSRASSIQENSQENDTARRLEDLGLFLRRPNRPDLAVALTRVNTFISWPRRQSHPPEAMAYAGFYFAGKRDKISCFYCGLCLQNLETSDDPWEKHCQLSPRCPYVILVSALPGPSAFDTHNTSGNAQSLLRKKIRRRWKHIVERPGQSARARNGRGAGSMGQRSRCLSCKRTSIEVLFPCGHPNACWDCYQCPSFLNHLQPAPSCQICGQQFKGITQDKFIQLQAKRFVQMRRIRSSYQTKEVKRCCNVHS